MIPSLLVFLAALLALSRGFYLPGLAPTNYCRDEVRKADPDSTCKVQAVSSPHVRRDFTFSLSLCSPQSSVFVHVNKLDSVETIVPYEFTR